METPAIQVNNLRTRISLCSSWPTLWSLSGGSSPLWELKQRQGPMIEISAIQVQDLHIGRSFWSNLPNVWPVRSGSSSLSSPTQRLEPRMESLGHSGEGQFKAESKKVARNYENASFHHVGLTDPYSHGDKGQIQTCLLLPLGTFNPGPDGANSHGGLVEFQKYKKKTKAMFWLYVRTEFCFFFFFFVCFFWPRLAPGLSTFASLP